MKFVFHKTQKSSTHPTNENQYPTKRTSSLIKLSFLSIFWEFCGKRSTFCGIANFSRGKCRFLVGLVGKLQETNFILWASVFGLWEALISCGFCGKFAGNEFCFVGWQFLFLGGVDFLWLLWEISGKLISFCG